MLNTKKIGDAVCVSYSASEILIRNPGKQYYGKEKLLVSIEGNTIKIKQDTIDEFGLEIKLI